MVIGPLQIVVILIIVLLIFGTKKLRNIGEDLGSAIKGFKEGMKETSSEKKPEEKLPKQVVEGQTIEGEVKEKKNS